MINVPDNVLNSGNRILVLAPHPDDETLGCGGTIALYAGMGKEVCAAIISKGEAVNVKAENIADLRRKETYKAAEILQIRQVVFMDFTDTALNTWYDEVKQGIKGLIQTFKPDIVFAPSPMDLHEDHVVVSRIAMSLLKEFGSFQVAFYEIYSPIRYNCIVDITDVIDIKKKAVMCYHYSLLEKPESMFFAMEGLNAYRSFDFLKKGYFEAFYVITSADSDDTIIEWLTHGLSKEASSYKFLSQLKKVDQLLSAYQQSLKKIDELEKKERGLDQCEHKQNAVKHSAAIKVICRIRDSIFPFRTKRRRFFETLINRIKTKH
ncbi:MAG: PIG-L family deacetylase [Thermodesulfovibrionales bacterium]